MRYLIVALTALFLCSGSTYAQSDILQKKISIELKAVTVKDALNAISVKAGCTFSYSDDIVPVSQKVHLKAKEQTLENVLNQLFAGTGISYSAENTNIILFVKTFVPDRSKKFTISGYVREKGSGEALLGVNVIAQSLNSGTVTNAYGFYSITLPSDSFELMFAYVGYEKFYKKIKLDADISLNVDMVSSLELSEVVIDGTKPESTVDNPLMSRIEIPVQHVKNIPAIFGEKDVLKVIQLMPGVQSGSEGQSGLYVRGGGPDQNLIILDDATVYNAFHLFGFLSLFNGDALRSIELTKGGFPARYGGRISSVLDINMKEGSKEKFRGEAGIGIIASRLVLEGPLKKNKSSFLISGRRTYVDVLMRPFLNRNQQAGYYFYDLTAKVNYDFGDKDKVYISSYFGQDRFYLQQKNENFQMLAGLDWGNFTSTLRWNHLYSNKLFSNTSFIFSNYVLDLGATSKLMDQEYKINFNSGIRDYSVKMDFDYLPNVNHGVKMGFISIYHEFTPKALVVKNDFSGENVSVKEKYYAFENGLYVEDNIKLTKRWRANLGMRLSHFLAEDRNYFRPEPRISTSYIFNNSTSVKAAFSVMNQYIHLLSNTGVGLPTDLWVPSTKRIGPQNSKQAALGFVKDFKKPEITLTIEGYYKKSTGVIGYKEGASFLSIDDPSNATRTGWEDNITTGRSLSYGLEILLQKQFNKFTGWIGYTLARTTLKFDELNNGEEFYARYDRRHDISVVGMYKLNENISLSGTWVYGTGNAITLPLAEYFAVPHNPNGSDPNSNTLYGFFASEYGEKNQFRMAPYHRLDFTIQFHKKLKYFERTLELGLYNAYNRKNPFFYYVGMNDAGTSRQLKQVSLFPVIPSISYHVKF